MLGNGVYTAGWRIAFSVEFRDGKDGISWAVCMSLLVNGWEYVYMVMGGMFIWYELDDILMVE